MRDVRVCRCCLSTKSKLVRISPSIKTTYSAISGISISDGDVYPMNLCMECYAIIRKIQLFRRRCRRAYFVLKEIMIVKKEVSLSAIENINRDRTNLNSLYDFSTGDNQSIYHITDLSDNVDETTVKKQALDTANTISGNFNELAKMKPVFINQHNIILTDIKGKIPDDEEPETIEEERKENSEDSSVEDQAFDNKDGENQEDIDLEDVFKGLEENEVESEEELSEPDVFKMMEKLGEKKSAHRKKKSFNKKFDQVKQKENEKRKKISEKLVTFKIRKLNTLEEQIHGHKMRLERPIYKFGFYKCSICVKTFVNKDELVKHSKEHSKDTTFPHLCKVCKVCKLRLKTERDLEIHSAVTHLYEYTCTICGAKKYTLEDIFDCNHKIKVRKDYIQDAIEKHFIRNSLPQHELAKTVKVDITYETTNLDAKYFCPRCNKEFRNEYVYEKHIMMHQKAKCRDGGTLMCDVCDTAFKSSANLQSHMLKNHLYSYICKHCHVELFSKSKVIKHKCGKLDTTTCGDCNKAFNDLELLAAHQTTKCKNRTNSDNWCNLCGLLYVSPYKLYYHQLTVHQYLSPPESLTEGPPEAYCDSCQVQFLDKDALAKHFTCKRHVGRKQRGMRSQAGENEATYRRSYTCTQCKRKFTSADAKSAHICKPPEPMPCFYCDEIFSSKPVRNTHMVRRHGITYKGDTCELCDICGVTVAVSNVKWHMKGHATRSQLVDDKWDACRYCFKKFTSVREGVRHIIIKHTNKPFMCALCPAMFTQRYDCRDHILKVHEPERPYKCETCLQDFPTLDYLRSHSQKTHSVNVKNTKRLRCGMFVYPFMKLNCTLLEPAVTEKWQLKICDFLDVQCKPVDNVMDHAVFDPALIPEDIAVDQNKSVLITPSSMKSKKRKNSVILMDTDLDDKADVQIKKKKVTVKSKYPEIYFKDKSRLSFDRVDTNIDIDDCARTKKAKKEFKMKIEDDITHIEPGYVYEETVIEDPETEGVCLEDSDEDKMSGDKYETLEEDGHQYVEINGVLYRVEEA